MAVFAVTYRYRSDSDAARDQYRPAHVDFLGSQREAGALLVSGPFADDPGNAGALLVWSAESAAALHEVIDQDPFHRHGLIAERVVREWTVVFGGKLEGR